MRAATAAAFDVGGAARPAGVAEAGLGRSRSAADRRARRGGWWRRAAASTRTTSATLRAVELEVLRPGGAGVPRGRRARAAWSCRPRRTSIPSCRCCAIRRRTTTRIPARRCRSRRSAGRRTPTLQLARAVEAHRGWFGTRPVGRVAVGRQRVAGRRRPPSPGPGSRGRPPTRTSCVRSRGARRRRRTGAAERFRPHAVATRGRGSARAVPRPRRCRT